MNPLRFFRTVAFLFLALASLSATAQEHPKGPKEVVEDTTDRVLRILEKHQARQNEKATQAMAREMLQALEPAVDFESIALGIMGQHRKAATEEQQQRFTQALKDTLAQLYVEALDEISIKSVDVQDLPADFDPDTDTETSVRMRATTENGDSYILSYSMRRSEAEGWVVRNIIADGVNLGLTYRSQFNDAMTRYQDIDTVIESWPKDIEPEKDAGEG